MSRFFSRVLRPLAGLEAAMPVLDAATTSMVGTALVF